MRPAALAATLFALAAASAAAAPPTTIRTGGPSAQADPKVAIVSSSKELRRFSVVDVAGNTVKRGRLRAARGSASPWPFAYRAVLGKLEPGAYRVRAGGKTSRVWRVDGGARRALIRRLLGIFQANADGNEVNPVFDPAHLNDAILETTGDRVDLVGGWRDAGDQLKFSRTTAFAVANLEIAARLDPADAALLRQTADVGIRWLLKAHPFGDTFVALVGDERDHSTDWRDPADDDADTRQGVGIRYAYPTVSSDELGIVAGALGLAAAGRSGQQRSALIAAAREWYERAKTTNAIVEIQDPNVSDYYPDDGFTDNLAFAATGLYRATGDATYLDEAAAYLRAGSDNEFYSGFTAGTVGPLAAADLCGGLGAPAVPNDAARRAGCDGLGKLVSAARERMAATAWGSPGIYMFGWVQDNAGAGALAAAAQRAGVVRDGNRIAAAARDYMRGRNPWGASFIVGRGTGEARNPHHSAFLKGRPAKLLDGAVVGGVTTRDQMRDFGLKVHKSRYRRFNSKTLVYEDRRENFETSEVGLVYSAASLLLAASLGG